jgi:phage gpG-like protein
MTIDLQKISLKVAERLKDFATDPGFAPVDTGELRKSHVVQSYGATDALLSANTPYAAAVHEGRRAVTIRPKSKAKLVWKGPNGKLTGAAYVNQPARAGNPWLRRAVEALSRDGLEFLEPDLGQDVANALTQALRAQGLTVTKL